jgi:hypothetical protein
MPYASDHVIASAIANPEGQSLVSGIPFGKLRELNLQNSACTMGSDPFNSPHEIADWFGK